LGGYPAGSRAGSYFFVAVFGSQLLYGLLIAGLDTLIAVGEVLFSAPSRPWLRHVAGAGGLTAYTLKRFPLVIAPALASGTEVLPIYFDGHLWGLWIAGYAKYSSDLWGQFCRVSASNA